MAEGNKIEFRQGSGPIFGPQFAKCDYGLAASPKIEPAPGLFNGQLELMLFSRIEAASWLGYWSSQPNASQAYLTQQTF